jgi:hypothetical protein
VCNTLPVLNIPLNSVDWIDIKIPVKHSFDGYFNINSYQFEIQYECYKYSIFIQPINHHRYQKKLFQHWLLLIDRL